MPSASWPVESIGVGPSYSRQVADQVEVLEREAHRVHDAVARRAHRVGAVRFEPLPQRSWSSRLPRLPRFVSTPGGGYGGGVPSRFSSTHLPRETGEVRVATDVTVSMLPCPSRPRRGLSAGSGTRRK